MGPEMNFHELSAWEGTMKNFAIILSGLYLAACNYQEFKQSPQGMAATPLEDAIVRFADVKSFIFENHCTLCHARYVEYEAVVADLSEIRARVESDNMPKNRPPLSPELKALLFAWIDSGAPL